MKRFLFIISISVIIIPGILCAQNSIKGIIKDEDNVPLVGATVFLLEMNKGTITDENGRFELLNLPAGELKIQFSFIGYANIVKTVITGAKDIELNIVMQRSFVEADKIIISGGYYSTQHENAVKIDVLKLDPQTMIKSPNFTEIITRVPGVDMISKGSGISKPVIRGLSMNEILILNNGVRFENYQYSDHHPLGIDEFGIENVEVIKGPASLIYGSDAIGGVINFIKEKPAPVGSIQGDYNLQMFSNTLGMTNNLGIKGTSKKISAGIRIGQKTNADLLQGGGKYVPNSRFNEYSFKTNTGYTGKFGTFKLFYDFNKQNLGLAEDEAVKVISKRARRNEQFYQQLNTHLISSQNKIYLGQFRMDLNAAFQNTGLIHFGQPGIYELQMNLATLTYDAKLYLPSDKNSEFIIGLQGINQNNKNLNNRETKLLPDATINNYSALGLIQHTFFTKLKLQSGIRYDFKILSSKTMGLPGDATYRAPLDKNYGSFSGSFGSTYNYSEKLLIRANFAAAYRTPNLAELTSNGQHEIRYEIGNHDLIPENSFETDLSIHYHIDNFTFELAGFYNIINHYIYMSPTNDTTGSGIYIYRYMQSNSTLFGGEAGIHIHPNPLKWLHVETTFSGVIGKKENGDYLPFVPAHKLQFELRAESEKLFFFQKTFISGYIITAFNQNNAAPDETKTRGYTLLDLNIGGDIKLNNQLISIGLGASNLIDKKYIDHLSTLKEVNFYNPGRNISFNLKIPFAGRKNSDKR